MQKRLKGCFWVKSYDLPVMGGNTRRKVQQEMLGILYSTKFSFDIMDTL